MASQCRWKSKLRTLLLTDSEDTSCDSFNPIPPTGAWRVVSLRTAVWTTGTTYEPILQSSTPWHFKVKAESARELNTWTCGVTTVPGARASGVRCLRGFSTTIARPITASLAPLWALLARNVTLARTKTASTRRSAVPAATAPPQTTGLADALNLGSGRACVEQTPGNIGQNSRIPPVSTGTDNGTPDWKRHLVYNSRSNCKCWPYFTSWLFSLPAATAIPSVTRFQLLHMILQPKVK